MKIKINQLYVNKTCLYLAPILNHISGTARLLNSGFLKLAFGVDDYLYQKKENRKIFILVYNKYRPILFNDSLTKLRLQEDYFDDYPSDEDKHMLVIKVNALYNLTYDNFIKGQYSKMYEKSFIDNFIKNKDARQVLMKTKNGEINYFNHLKDIWGIEKPSLLNLKEYDEPPKYKEEVFNYQNSKPIYFKNGEL